MNNVYEVKIGHTSLKIVEDDITHQRTSVIVNATNSRLQPGGGVDRAIHTAAGSSVLAELRKKYTECLPGDVVITNAGNLSKSGIKKIFHTVGPLWHGHEFNESQVLASSYIKCLQAAFQNNLDSISFPAISTGAYGYPIEKAAKVALSAVLERISESLRDVFTEIIFVLFTENDFKMYKKTLEELLVSTESKVSKP